MIALTAYGALFAAILAALLRLDSRGVAALLALSIVTAVASGAVAPVGLLALAGGLVLLAGAVAAALPASVRALCVVGLGLYALAAAFHLFPGFPRLPVVEGFGRDGARTLSWIYDKGYAGLLLVWLHQSRVPASAIVDGMARRLGLILAGTGLILLLSYLAGLATPDARLLHGLAFWILGNMFLTVAAEEGFFRGLLQRYIERALAPRLAAATVLAVVVTAVLFGVVHLAWGAAFAAIAVIAGLYYGLMYGRRRSLGWAITAHGGINAAIIVGFASPVG